jgi:hypothetical protein
MTEETLKRIRPHDPEGGIKTKQNDRWLVGGSPGAGTNDIVVSSDVSSPLYPYDAIPT